MRRLATAATVALLLVGLALPALAGTDHCPNHNGHPGKVEGNSNGLILDAGTEFCVKAGPEASGTLVADGQTTLGGYVTWTVGKGNTPDVSYYVVYSTPTTTTVPDTTTTTEPEPTTTQPEDTTTTAPQDTTTTQPEVTTTVPDEVSPTVIEQPTTTIEQIPELIIDDEPQPQPQPQVEVEKPEELPHTGPIDLGIGVAAAVVMLLGYLLVQGAREGDE